MNWINDIMLLKESNISVTDLDFIKIVDTAKEAFEAIDEFYKSNDLSPNF